MRTTALAIILMMLGCASTAFAAEPHTAKVVAATAVERVPWDGFVDVDVTVYIPVSGTTAAISLSATDGARSFEAATLEGETVATTSGVYRVSWNVAADYPDLYAPSFVVSASATATGFVPDAYSGSYMVIDLSGGAGAAAYPVTYLTEVPEDGWYQLGFRYESMTTNVASYKDIKLDGVIPFSELSEYCFPYADGWKISGDSQEYIVDPVDGVFTTFLLSKSTSNIKMTYTVPRLPEGILLSACGVVLLIVVIFLESDKRKKKVPVAGPSDDASNDVPDEPGSDQN